MAKTKPIGVRFDIELLDLIKKEQGVDSPQKVLNWLLENYSNLKNKPMDFNPITHSERPSDPHKGVKYKKAAKAQLESKKAVKPPEIKPKTPPAGLKGIDLAIWKAENA